MTHTTDSQTRKRRTRIKGYRPGVAKCVRFSPTETADERHEREQSAWLRKAQL